MRRHDSILRVLILALATVTLGAGLLIASEPTTTDGSRAREIEELEARVSARIEEARTIQELIARRSAYEAAVPDAERLASMRPDAESYHLLVSAHLGASRHLEAKATSELWAERYPGDWRAHLSLGQSLHSALDYAAALAPLERAFSLVSSDADRKTVGRHLGFVLEHRRRFHDALALYQQVGATDSATRVRENLDAPRSSGAPSDPDHEEEARRLVEELRVVEADLEAQVSALIRQARRTRQRTAKRQAYEAAIPQAEKLVSMRPEPGTYSLLADAQLGANRLVEARTTSELWTASDPQSWRAHLVLGQSWYLARDYLAALAPLERAFSLAGAEADRKAVARSYGFVLEKLRRLEEAVAIYEQVEDANSAARVRENILVLESMENAPLYHGPPPGFDEEARRLEEELRALEEEDQGSEAPPDPDA